MIIPPGFIHVQYLFGGPGAPNGAAITHGAEAGTYTDASELANILFDEFAGVVMPELCDDVQLQGVRVKFGPNTTGQYGEHTETVTGGKATEGAVANTAYLVRKRTVLGGRKNQGRLYIPGVQEAKVGSNGSIDTLTASDLQTDLNTWFTNLETIGTPMKILHNSETTPTAVTALVLDGKVATQRRRLRS